MSYTFTNAALELHADGTFANATGPPRVSFYGASGPTQPSPLTPSDSSAKNDFNVLATMGLSIYNHQTLTATASGAEATSTYSIEQEFFNSANLTFRVDGIIIWYDAGFGSASLFWAHQFATAIYVPYGETRKVTVEFERTVRQV